MEPKEVVSTFERLSAVVAQDTQRALALMQIHMQSKQWDEVLQDADIVHNLSAQLFRTIHRRALEESRYAITNVPVNPPQGPMESTPSVPNLPANPEYQERMQKEAHRQKQQLAERRKPASNTLQSPTSSESLNVPAVSASAK